MALPTDDLLGLVIGYTDIPSTVVGASDMNRPRMLLHNLFQVFLKTISVNGILKYDTDRCVFNQTTKRITPPTAGLTFAGIVGGIPMLMTSGMEVSGTVDSASTTTLTDTTLSEAASYWVNATVLFTSGANAGLSRTVTAFDATLHRLTLNTALAVAPTAGDGYTVTFFNVTGLTNSTTNYIFANVGSDSVTRAIMTFTADTTATPADGQVLVSSAILDGSGVCTSVDDTPTDVARGLYTNQGGYDVLSGSGTVTDLAGSSYVDIVISHDQLLYAGGITCAITSGASGTLVPTVYYGDSGFTMRLTNGSGSPVTYSYSWTRSGRKLQYAV